MPNSRTFTIPPIKEWIDKSLYGAGEKILWNAPGVDPFAANSYVGEDLLYDTITNDLNPKFDTDFNKDALEFLKMFDDESVSHVIFDPPYSPRQLKECYDGIGQSLTDAKTSVWSKWKDEIARITMPGGFVLSFGWNSVGMGINRGFQMQDILMVCHGSMHNDTICTKERKL